MYGYVGNNPIMFVDPFGLTDCAALTRQLEQAFVRLNHDSDMLRGFLNSQYGTLGDLYWIDRAQDTAFALTGNLAGKVVNSVRIALTSEGIGQGASLGVDLVRGGALTGAGLSASTSFQTAGVGGEIAGPLASKAIASGLNATAKQFARQWTTRGVREQVQETIDQLNADLSQQRQSLRSQIDQYHKCGCK